MNTLHKILFILAVCFAPFYAEAKDIFIPDKIYSNGASAYLAGTNQELGIVPSGEFASPEASFEYGVARAVQDGQVTSFDIMSTESTKDVATTTLHIKIPNPFGDTATTTYVMYIKSFVPNNPESENFFVTKKFMIVQNSDPFIQIKAINLLQSTGERYRVSEGPFIYNPDIQSGEEFATSTAIEVILLSNQDITLHPIVSFSKLRSNTKMQPLRAQDIVLKKGEETYATLNLPVFDYNPGIYKGSVDFGSSFLPTKTEFQYIVAGDSVTVGEALYSRTDSGRNVRFDIFDTPVDQERFASSTVGSVLEKSNIYTVVSIFKQGDTVVHKDTRTVDFTGSNFTVDLPSNIRVIDTAYVEVVSSLGKTVYTGEKYLGVHEEMSQIYFYINCLLGLLILILLLKKKYKLVIIFVTLSIFVFWLTSIALAGNWSPKNYLISGKSLNIYLNADPTTQTYTCGEDLSVMIRSVYTACSNQSLNVAVGLSTESFADAKNKAVLQNRSFAGSTAYKTQSSADAYYNKYAASHPGFVINSKYCHTNKKDKTHCGVFFTYTSPFAQYTVGGVKGTDNKLYMSVTQKVDASTYNSKYEFPINVSGGACIDKSTGGSSGGSGCGAGTYYCDVTKSCLPSGTACNASGSAIPDIANPLIPRSSIAPVTLKTLEVDPLVVNKGGSCTIAWSNAFTTYDKYTVCTFTGPTMSTGLTFAASTTNVVNFTSGPLRADGMYRMSCVEVDDAGGAIAGTTQTTDGICRVNLSYKEVN